MRWLCVKLVHHSGIPVCKNSPWMLRNVQLLWGCNASGYRFLSGHQSKKKLQDYYSLLNVDEECSVEDVRNSYCMLAKKYHPDSGSTTADARMFMQIDEAYRAVLNHISNTTQSAIEPDEDDDKLKYRAPQHRQYLSYEGIGFGTPSQREKQYIQYRVDRATDLLMDFKKQKLESQYAEDAMVAKDIKKSKKVKITQAIERLVEDLILESMAKGDFDNLSGRGKPLDKFSYCPHIDPMTHNLNRILMDNGYQPEWITMQKEIRETIEKLRNEMVMARKKCGNPMTLNQKKIWNQTCEEFSQNIKTLNKRINDFNLIVPLLNWQMVHFNVEKEIARAHKSYEALMEAKEKETEIINKRKEAMETSSSHKTTFLAWLNLLFK